MSALDPLFADAFGDKGARRVWFAQALQSAMAANDLWCICYRSVEIAKAALEMTARKRGIGLDDERGRRIMRGLAALPAHGDVPDGLARLRDAGYRIVVLAQASEETLELQLEHARIRPFVERVFSADAVRRFQAGAGKLFRW